MGKKQEDSLNEINEKNIKQELTETQLFFLLYLKTIAAGLKLVTGQRRSDYGAIPIREYWKVNGVKAPLQMVWMKCLRAISASENNNTTSMIDSLIDCINYCAFTVAEILFMSKGKDAEMDLFLEDTYDIGDYEKTILDAIEKIESGKM